MSSDTKSCPFMTLTEPTKAERDHDPLTETTVKKSVLFQSPFVQLVREDVVLPGKETSVRYMLPHRGASAMIPLDDEGMVILERQWRHPCKKAFWEIPAGKIDPDESPLEAAKRELKEECGILGETWTYLGVLRNAIGYSDESITVYLVEDLTFEAQALDPGEYLEVVRVPLEVALRMCDEGYITDCKTLIGLYWLSRRLAKKTE